jgi:hypothetical protein
MMNNPPKSVIRSVKTPNASFNFIRDCFKFKTKKDTGGKRGDEG